MNGQRNQSWSVAELVPLILLGLVGLSCLFAAPTKLRSSTTVPQRAPRHSPAKPPSANKMMLVHLAPRQFRLEGPERDLQVAATCEVPKGHERFQRSGSNEC